MIIFKNHHLSGLEDIRLSLNKNPEVTWFLSVEAYFAEGHGLSMLDLPILEHQKIRKREISTALSM